MFFFGLARSRWLSHNATSAILAELVMNCTQLTPNTHTHSKNILIIFCPPCPFARNLDTADQCHLHVWSSGGVYTHYSTKRVHIHYSTKRVYAYHSLKTKLHRVDGSMPESSQKSGECIPEIKKNTGQIKHRVYTHN